jgi:hypothetical protein
MRHAEAEGIISKNQKPCHGKIQEVCHGKKNK